MIRRSFDIPAFNAVINHPSVFPWVTLPGIEFLDGTELIKDERNVLIEASNGFFLGCYESPGVYEVHTQFYPWARTKQTIADGYESMAYMFKEHCYELITRVPQNNKAADWFTRRMGFKFWFKNEKVWPTKDGLYDLSFYRLLKCL